MKKSEENYFDKNRHYRSMKGTIAEKHGRMTSDSIWRRAGENYEELMECYKDAPKGEARHLYRTILPRMAMYRALQEEMADLEAMALLDENVKTECTKVGLILRKITSFPAMPRAFMWLFTKMIKNMFGSKNGFKQQFYEESSTLLRFDILQCPYYMHCVENNCPELTHTFCDSDVYCYGNLSHIKFERTQTLGTGGSRCDFKLTREN